MHRLLTGEQLRPFVPQSTHMGLITTGDKYAVFTKGWLCFEVSLLLQRHARPCISQYDVNTMCICSVNVFNTIARP